MFCLAMSAEHGPDLSPLPPLGRLPHQDLDTRSWRGDGLWDATLVLGALLVAAGFLFDPPAVILRGLQAIYFSPSNLITDYLYIAGGGATLINSGSVILSSALLLKRLKVAPSGVLLAAVLTLAGFAFFGKNLFNSLPITFGTYVFARYRKEPLATFIVPALFGTTLAPLVSELSFGYGLPLWISIPLGYLAGALAGFVISPLATYCLAFHQGFNLYNTGFTAGILAMLAAAVMRLFDLPINPVSLFEERQDWRLWLLMIVLIISLAVFAIVRSRGFPGSLFALQRAAGRMPTEWTEEFGVAGTLLNMSLVGAVALLYVALNGGVLNGPVIGGVLTVIGFGAYGKNIRNIIPLLIGVYLAQRFGIHEPSTTRSLLAALFSTTLAPIAGRFGPFAGILAGVLHAALSANLGNVHGGINLYHNGFAGGFVAAVLVALFESLGRRIRRNPG